MADRRPQLRLMPEGKLPAIDVEVVARLPTHRLIVEPVNWTREAVAMVCYAVTPAAVEPGDN